MYNYSLVAPLLDVAFCCLERDAEFGCDIDKCLAVKFSRQFVEEELATNCFLAVTGACCGSLWKFAEDFGGMKDQDLSYYHCAVEVIVDADKGVLEIPVVHDAEGRQDHCNAEGDESESADGCDHFFSVFLDVFVL